MCEDILAHVNLFSEPGKKELKTVAACARPSNASTSKKSGTGSTCLNALFLDSFEECGSAR